MICNQAVVFGLISGLPGQSQLGFDIVGRGQPASGDLRRFQLVTQGNLKQIFQAEISTALSHQGLGWCQPIEHFCIAVTQLFDKGSGVHPCVSCSGNSLWADRCLSPRDHLCALTEASVIMWSCDDACQRRDPRYLCQLLTRPCCLSLILTRRAERYERRQYHEI